MDKDKVIHNTERFVKSILNKDSTGHDWWHIERVRNNALHIHALEKGNWLIIDLALMLHDVGDRKVINNHDDDYSIAENFLTTQGVPKDMILQIMFIIENMSFSKTLKRKSEDISKEFQIVQDADRLDAIGAIGIARAFTYGGARGRVMYDPLKSAEKFDSSEDYRKLENSTINHFEEKLFSIKDLLNTETAKGIADQRHNFMKKYVQQFFDEWYGKK